MELNKMIEEFEEATELAESCSHTKDTEYTKLCREVANFLNWFKDSDLIDREFLLFQLRDSAVKSFESGFFNSGTIKHHIIKSIEEIPKAIYVATVDKVKLIENIENKEYCKFCDHKSFMCSELGVCDEAIIKMIKHYSRGE